jgi:molybdopterin molybdotransferase
MLTYISLEEAQEILLRHCRPVPAETVPLAEAWGRVLATDLIATENIPPFTRSPYDGYAMRAADIASASRTAPVKLRVLEEIPAGFTPTLPLKAGEATQVFTGAPLPEGADCVEKYEDLDRAGDNLTVYAPLRGGQNVVPVGEDIRLGQPLAAAGLVVNGALMGLLASMGRAEVSVRRRPRVAVISTGDELIDIAAPLSPGKIRNSNCYALCGYIRALGGEPVIIGTARDRIEEVAGLITAGLAAADLVVTTGGASVGDYDVMQDAMTAAGAELLFWKLALKPGGPTLAAVKDGQCILGLSGNPAAALLIFLLLGGSMTHKLAGREGTREIIDVTLLSGFPKKSPARRFLRGKLTYREDGVYFDPAGEQNNDALSSLLQADALADVPAGSGPLPAGTKLKAVLL